MSAHNIHLHDKINFLKISLSIPFLEQSEEFSRDWKISSNYP